jgi:hypothetical protein
MDGDRPDREFRIPMFWSRALMLRAMVAHLGFAVRRVARSARIAEIMVCAWGIVAVGVWAARAMDVPGLAGAALAAAGGAMLWFAPTLVHGRRNGPAPARVPKHEFVGSGRGFSVVPAGEPALWIDWERIEQVHGLGDFYLFKVERLPWFPVSLRGADAASEQSLFYYLRAAGVRVD